MQQVIDFQRCMHSVVFEIIDFSFKANKCVTEILQRQMSLNNSI